MEYPARILIAFSVLLVLSMMFAGCSDNTDPGSTPTETTAAPGGPLYSEGDIVQLATGSSSSSGFLIIGYNSATDSYTRAVIHKNSNGQWGYRTNSDTSTIEREELERVYTKIAAHVTVSSIPTRAPTPVPTTITTVKTTARTATTTTTTTVGKPSIKSTDPEEAYQGDTVDVEIEGSNFRDGATVRLEHADQDDIDGVDVEWESSTSMTCTFEIPDEATVGTWDVVVRNPDGKEGTNANYFRVRGTESSSSTGDPVITEIDPDSASRGESFEMEITGLHFDADAEVRLERSGEDDIEAYDVDWESSKSITASFDIPSNADTGYWVVVVTNPGNSYDTISNAFRIRGS